MSNPSTSSRKVLVLLTAAAMAACLGGAASAQDRGGAMKLKVARSITETVTLRRTSQSADARSLTINRRPETAPSDGFDDGQNSATVDGPTRYNSISTFNPVPYVEVAREIWTGELSGVSA